MNKMRADATWNGLTTEQQGMLESWLFEENMSYKEARDRAERQFGIAGSVASIGRYYRRMLLARTVDEMSEVRDSSEKLNGTKVKVESLRASALKVIGKTLLEKAMAGGDVKELAALGHLMTESEHREIQRQRLALARDRFEFRAAEAALAQMPKMEEMTVADLERERARIKAIQQSLFGKNLDE